MDASGWTLGQATPAARQYDSHCRCSARKGVPAGHAHDDQPDRCLLPHQGARGGQSVIMTPGTTPPCAKTRLQRKRSTLKHPPRRLGAVAAGEPALPTGRSSRPERSRDRPCRRSRASLQWVLHPSPPTDASTIRSGRRATWFRRSASTLGRCCPGSRLRRRPDSRSARACLRGSPSPARTWSTSADRLSPA